MDDNNKRMSLLVGRTIRFHTYGDLYTNTILMGGAGESTPDFGKPLNQGSTAPIRSQAPDYLSASVYVKHSRLKA